MELQNKTRILAGLCIAQVEAHASSVRFGYWEKPRSVSEVTSLIHLRVSKALEVATIGDGPSRLQDVSRLEEALADVIIATLDLGAGLNLSLGPAVLTKMDQNESLSMFCRKEY